jgi:hypothetical protein
MFRPAMVGTSIWSRNRVGPSKFLLKSTQILDLHVLQSFLPINMPFLQSCLSLPRLANPPPSKKPHYTSNQIRPIETPPIPPPRPFHLDTTTQDTLNPFFRSKQCLCIRISKRNPHPNRSFINLFDFSSLFCHSNVLCRCFLFKVPLQVS